VIPREGVERFEALESLRQKINTAEEVIPNEGVESAKLLFV